MFRLTKYYSEKYVGDKDVQRWNFKEEDECYIQACFEIQKDSTFQGAKREIFQDHINKEDYVGAFDYYDEITSEEDDDCYQYEIEDFGEIHLDTPKIPTRMY